MFTSYFGNVRKSLQGQNVVAIAQGIPKWYTGKRYMPLAPSWALIRLTDEAEYCRGYAQVLAKLDARGVYEFLGGDAILLCWEKPGEFCHRRLVAEWLQLHLGITVPEWGQGGLYDVTGGNGGKV